MSKKYFNSFRNILVNNRLRSFFTAPSKSNSVYKSYSSGEVEYIDLVDENNNIIGITDAKTAHEKKQYHRVVAVLLFDQEDKLILQSETKYNALEMSVGGHVRRGESYESAAHREMFEEIKVRTDLLHVSTFLPKNNTMGHFWSIYVGNVPGGWEFEETDEVKSIVRVSLKEIFRKIKQEPGLFTNGSLNIINEYKRIKVSTHR